MSYYIVGSKYQYVQNKYEDVLPQMLADNSLCVGYSSNLDLTNYYNKSEDEIVEYLKQKGENKSSYNALKKYLNLQEGDLVAIKSFSAPLKKTPRIIISAIGVVVKRNGNIYKYEPENYGHRINLEFLKKGLHEEYNFSYSQTIHKLTQVNHIIKIFKEQIDKTQTVLLTSKKDGVLDKNIEDQLRKINIQYIAAAYHNRIQTKLYSILISIYGKSKVQMEVDFIDLLVNTNDETILYEVKPYNNGKNCIRESLGQLLEYSWYKRKHFENKKIKLVVVGPQNLNAEELRYFKYIKKNISIALEYQVISE